MMLSSFFSTFSTELGRFWYTVMPFGATVAGDVFQRKLDETLIRLLSLSVYMLNKTGNAEKSKVILKSLTSFCWHPY